MPRGITTVILGFMKTAISIPDPIFQEAESLAKRLSVSRSELFTRAVKDYIEEHKHDRVREALDELFADEDSSLDPVLAQLQSRALSEPEEW